VENPDTAKAREILTGDLKDLGNVAGKPQRRESHGYADRGLTTWVIITDRDKAWEVLTQLIRTVLITQW
jgi:hypothetical protein